MKTSRARKLIEKPLVKSRQSNAKEWVNFSKKADSLYELLKKKTAYSWTNKQQEAFDELKKAITIAPVVRYPDFEKPFLLYTDTSLTGLGAVLAQKEGKEEYVIAYTSQTLLAAERNYGITELECLAIVWAINYFRHYVYSSNLTIITDHSALT